MLSDLTNKISMLLNNMDINLRTFRMFVDLTGIFEKSPLYLVIQSMNHYQNLINLEETTATTKTKIKKENARLMEHII